MQLIVQLKPGLHSWQCKAQPLLLLTGKGCAVYGYQSVHEYMRR